MSTTLLTLTRALSVRSNKLNWLRANMWADNRLVSAEGITDEISEARLAAMVKRARATWAENHKHWTAESDAEFMACQSFIDDTLMTSDRPRDSFQHQCEFLRMIRKSCP